MRFKDVINPIKWYAYSVFLFRKVSGRLAEKAGYNTPEDLAWKSEVIVYRGLLCGDCKSVGKCIGIPDGETEACGCDFIGITTDMSQACGCGKWKAVKDKEDWERQKESDYKSLKLDFRYEA